MISGWRVLDQFTIEKGLGHFDFEELLQKLVGYSDEAGHLDMFPRPSEDIGGGDMTGVEADAMWEAIYQGQSSGLAPEDAALIFAGPNGPHGMQGYQAAVQKAIQCGAPTINKAIEISNAEMMQKWQENPKAATGEEPQPMAIPLAFQQDLGRMILTQDWRDGVAGAMDKKRPFENGLTGPKLRTVNRDQHNKFSESWARPYHKGLKELRGSGSTREYIESHRVHPNTVYIDIEGKNAIFDMFDTAKQNGQPITDTEQLRALWAAHPILSKKMPHFGSPMANPHNYGIRDRHPHVAEPMSDVAEQQVDMQQEPVNYMDSFNDEVFRMKSGKNMFEGRQLDNALRTYAPQLRRQFIEHHGLDDEKVPSVEELFTSGPHKLKRNLMEGLHLALTGQQAHTPPQAQVPPQQPVTPPQEPVAQTPPPPQQLPQQLPIPVPQEAQRQPVPQIGQAPPIPTRQAPQDLNANQSGATPPSQSGIERRGIMDRIGEALGGGAAKVANLFTREEIANALETVQIDIALQNDTIIKMIPHLPMDNHSIADISFIAGQVKRPASDVVAILNSRGDWREMSKSMDVPLEIIQLVKVAFR